MDKRELFARVKEMEADLRTLRHLFDDDDIDYGHLYVVEDKARGLCKVGMSKKPENRIKSILSGAGLPDDSFHFISPTILSPRTIEKAVHNELAPFRVKGEWFNCEVEFAMNMCMSMTEPASDSDIEVVDVIRKYSAPDILGLVQAMWESALCKNDMGEKTVLLNGSFTAADLRRIADRMEA